MGLGTPIIPGPQPCPTTRSPPHAQVELQRQLPQVAGGLILDPLQGPLLHLPHGDHPGAEGCNAEVPERYGEAVGGDGKRMEEDMTPCYLWIQQNTFKWSPCPCCQGPALVSHHVSSVLLCVGFPMYLMFVAISGSSALSSALLLLLSSIPSSGLTLTPLSSAVGGTVLSIQDEMENVFVWEHLQAYEGQSKGAWLGMTFNPKGTGHKKTLPG